MSGQLNKWSVVGVVTLVASALVPAASWQSDAASPEASSATSTAAPHDGRIVAFNIDTGRLETLNPDGSARQAITPAGENDFQPAWSPDGARIAFASDHAGPDPRIFTIKADGSGMQQLTTAPEGYVDNTPTYTPDGKHILFARCRPDPPGGCALFSIRPNGQDLTPVTTYGDRADFYPDVTPDGTRLTFVRFDDHGIIAQVYVAKIDGSHAHAITTPELEAGSPQWTADGHHVLVTSSINHFGTNVYRVREDGKTVTQLTSAKFPHNAQFATPSPSGKKIVYSDDQAYRALIGFDLVVMNPDGSGKHAIATQTRLGDADWGTAPLIKGTTPPAPSSAKKASARPAMNAPSWLAPEQGHASPSTSKWSR